MRGWLLDTNVIASLAAPNGAPSVKAWAAGQDEGRLFLSVITLAEYDKGINQLPDEDPLRVRYSAKRDAIEGRFASRVLPLSNNVVRRWGAIAGRIRRDTGHPPSVIDTLFAATAIEAQLYLVTRNTKDVQHSGAATFNPWVDDVAGFPLLDESRQTPTS
ncbi:type II toxin-antitoxin system VapC family toxin [Phenylobacterium sp.]|uniref:type II toxin-antitoxin system VapC family toxin n=1 Tax=Phenylobacterium sp. TaxID=1871053 RepID=UPI00121DF6AF|nr:type II toxin-antitoxin system VapC family toxin [Phenylobacterium sp.]THD60143.1 MAG: type II toxin-antitoxin system VapC family toxin [Phenylobacterium sp.]